MLLGIISDTHDDMQAIKKAVEIFNSRGVSYVIHAGDMVSPFTIEVFRDLKATFSGIFGNNDGDRVLLKERYEGRLSTQPLITDIGGKRIAVVHEPAPVESLARSGDFDLVIYGHTHIPATKKIGDTLVINPGKAAKLHKGKQTLVIIDLDTMEPEFIDLA